MPRSSVPSRRSSCPRRRIALVLGESVVQPGSDDGTDVHGHHRTRIRPARAGDVRDSQADLGRARSALGYEPSVDFEEGLRRTLEAST